MTLRIILKSGAEFSVICNGNVTLSKDALGSLTGYKIQGITENKPLYIDLTEVAAILRVKLNEAEEA